MAVFILPDKPEVSTLLDKEFNNIDYSNDMIEIIIIIIFFLYLFFFSNGGFL